MRERSELQLLEEIGQKLEMLIASVASMRKKRTSQAKILSSRFKPAEIADILGTTPNTVRVLLHKARKKTTKEPQSGVGDRWLKKN